MAASAARAMAAPERCQQALLHLFRSSQNWAQCFLESWHQHDMPDCRGQAHVGAFLRIPASEEADASDRAEAAAADAAAAQAAADRGSGNDSEGAWALLLQTGLLVVQAMEALVLHTSLHSASHPRKSHQQGKILDWTAAQSTSIVLLLRICPVQAVTGAVTGLLSPSLQLSNS